MHLPTLFFRVRSVMLTRNGSSVQLEPGGWSRRLGQGEPPPEGYPDAEFVDCHPGDPGAMFVEDGGKMTELRLDGETELRPGLMLRAELAEVGAIDPADPNSAEPEYVRADDIRGLMFAAYQAGMQLEILVHDVWRQVSSATPYGMAYIDSGANTGKLVKTSGTSLDSWMVWHIMLDHGIVRFPHERLLARTVSRS